MKKMKKDRGKFRYKKRSSETVSNKMKKRSGFDSPFGNDVPFFSPKEGDHRIRILPPTWDDAEDYGVEVYVHNNVGPDRGRYLCPKRMKNEPCAVCDEQARARRDGEDEKYLISLHPSRRTAVLLVDRDHEKDGPQLWPMPYKSVDREITARLRDPKSGETLAIDDPDEGYDVMFRVEGSQRNTEYLGVEIARRSSPLSDDPDLQDEWLAYAQKHPVKDLLQFYDYDHVKGLLEGGGGRKRDDDEDEEGRGGRRGPSTRSERSRRDEDDEDDDRRHRDRKGKSRDDDEDEEDEDEEDEEEETRPRKKERAKIEDEDEDLDEEEDEDERPRKKSKRRDDEDEEEEDEDEEPRRKVKRAKLRDEDEEDRPRKKKRHRDRDEPSGSRSGSRVQFREADIPY